ncbi:chemotaxis protein CheW [Halotia wernerae UHCC 0503]|jgi:purine-binding chemotaxis protein CheW|nr:chemotaxis protein CheW [Halotia wernerae UHCC 0503]
MAKEGENAAANAGHESQFVSFEIGGTTFLIPIDRVIEFRTWTEPTQVPHTPAYVRGIVNIRGEIVPIYDVAARLGRGTTDPGARHVVVIVRGHEGRSVGLLVDSVTDIVAARDADRAPMPSIEGGDATPFMAGVVFSADRILGVTDVDRLVEETFPHGEYAVAEGEGPPA